MKKNEITVRDIAKKLEDEQLDDLLGKLINDKKEG